MPRVYVDSSVVSGDAGLAESAPIRDDPSEMTDQSFRDQVAESVSTPRLRLAGTTAGPLSDAEQSLLDLRHALIQASSHVQRDAVAIRGRLERSGRRDPVQLTTGQDVFERSQIELGRLLAAVEDRLETVSAPEIDIEPGVESLLRRS